MKKLLHIIATPRGEDSRTLKVSKAFLETFGQKHPDWQIDELNVAIEPLLPLTVKIVSGKYVLLGGKELAGELKGAWREVIRHIERFLSADIYLISTPMWNFGIPYTLKQYIDIIVQPKYLFEYAGNSVEGLAKNKKMAVITSRGGDYGPQSPFHAYDFQEPYLRAPLQIFKFVTGRAIFGFVGITDITFIHAQPMDAMGAEVEKKKVEEAKIAARKVAEKIL